MKKRFIAKRIISVLGILGLLAGVTACGKSAGSEDTLGSIRVGVVGTSTRGGIYALAEELGYYKEEGVDVTLEHLGNPTEILAALNENKVDVSAFAISPQINSIGEGHDLVFVGGTGNIDERLFALKENAEEYSKIENLIGKKIAADLSSAAEVAIKQDFEEAGYDYPSCVDLTYYESTEAILQAIAKGDVDAGFLTVETTSAAERLGEVPIRSFEDDVCCRQTVRRETVNENRDALVAFEVANLRAYEYTISNKDDAVSILSKYSQLDEEEVEQEITFPGYLSVDPDTRSINTIYKDSLVLGRNKEVDDINAHIDASIYEEALNKLIEKNPDNTTYKELKEEFGKKNS